MTDAEVSEWRREARELVAEIGARRVRLQALAKKLAETSAYKNVTIDEMTAETWQAMTTEERVNWVNYWKGQGYVSFHCLKCGFPTSERTVGCSFCTPT